MPTYDVLVLGIGGVGSAALYHAAARGAKAIGIDRFPPAHDRGSSHGRTRLIRLAYFEHPDYVPLLRRAFVLWDELEQRSGRRLYFPVGLLQAGAPCGRVVPGVLRSAAQHHLDVESLAPDEVERRFPGFRLPPDWTAVFEKQAGYLLVEDCIRAHLDHAAQLGAEIRTDETVQAWRAVGDGVEVVTDRRTYSAGRLIVTAGAWTSAMAAELGLPLEVRRKPLYWFQTKGPAYRADAGCPGYLFETRDGVFYGFPQIDDLGIKAAEHSGGRVVDDPLNVDRSPDARETARLERFLADHLPQATPEVAQFAVCMYTMTPDENFIVDRHPVHPQTALAAGLSGHGFKFAGVLGEVLVQLALDGGSPLPIQFLAADRPALQRTTDFLRSI